MGQDSKKLRLAARQVSLSTSYVKRSLGLLMAGLITVGLTGCSARGGADIAVEPQRLSPETLMALESPLLESSGLALVDNQIWSMNDSAGASRLYGFDLNTKATNQVLLNGAINFDWEALATSDSDLYVVDCGNNRGDRIWLQLYKLALSQLTSVEITVERSDFRWGDVEYSISRRNHNNDCEAATWIGDQLWLFTKNWQDQNSRVYHLKPNDSPQSLMSTQSLAVGGLITGADYSAANQTLALVGYGAGVNILQPFIWLVPLLPDAQKIDWSLAKRFDIAESGQWEAIHWQGDKLLLTREKSILGRAKVARLTLPAAALSN